MYKEIFDVTVSQFSGETIYYDLNGRIIDDHKKYRVLPKDIETLLKNAKVSPHKDVDFSIDDYYGYQINIYKRLSSTFSYIVVIFLNSFEMNTINELIPVGLIKLNKNLEIIYANEHAQSIMGLSFDEIINRNWVRLLNESSYDKLLYSFKQHDSREKSFKEIIQVLSPLGKKRVLSMQVIFHGIDLETFSSGVSYYIVLLDITQEYEASEEIQYLATHDKLTNLANRDFFIKAIKDQYAEGNLENSGLLFLDLDGFKKINDTLGHSYGDEVLKIVANKLKNNIKERDIAARFGGDEFAVFFRDIEAESAFKIAHKIANVINQTVMIENKHIEISSSIGFSSGECSFELLKDEDNIDGIIDKWLEMVDLAMYESKKEKKGTVTFFDTHIRNKHIEFIEQEHYLSTLIKELDETSFKIFFQPIFKNKSVYSLEALARFDKYDIKELMKVSYLSGKCALFYPLLFKKGLEAYKSFLEATKRDDIKLNINTTAGMLSETKFYNFCIEQCNKFALSPRNICLEITEQALENDMVVFSENIEKLIDYGFEFSIDDFGSGYSSIKRLTDYDFSQIKLDRTLIQDIGKNSKQQKALAASVEFGKVLDMEVLLEGVQDKTEHDFADSLNIVYRQGFYYAKPQSLEDIIKYVQDEKNR